MAERSVRFDFTGRDISASSTAGKIGRSYEGLGSKLGTFGKTAGLALGGAAVGGVALLGKAMFDGVKAAQSYQTLGLQTAAVIKSTGNVARLSVKGVQTLAGSLESMSGIDEELIIHGENVLATFTNIRNETGKGNDIFNQATRAAVNLSAALGQDMQSSAIQLGKALNDPVKGITALSRVGVSFTSEQKAQVDALVKSGRTMQAQKLILGELAREFGGAAKAAGGGLGGALARLSDAWGDLWRGVMTRALPALTRLTDWTTQTAMPVFDRIVGFINDSFIPGVASALGHLGDHLPSIDLSGIGKAIAGQASTWGAAIISGVRTGLDTGDWSALGKTIGGGLRRATVNITGWLTDLFSRVDWLELGKRVGQQTTPFVIGLVGNLLDIDTIWKSMKQHPGDWIIGVISVLGVGKLGSRIAEVVAKIPILRVFAPLFEKLHSLTEPINNAIGKIVGLFGTGFREGFGRVFPSVEKRLGGWVEGLILRVLYAVDRMAAAGRRLVIGLGRGIGEAAAAPLKAAGELIAKILRPFAPAGRWLLDAGGDLIRGLWAGIRGAMGGVGRVLGEVKGAIVGGLKRLFGIHSPSTVMAGLGGNIISGLIRGMLTSSGALSRVVKGIGGGVSALFGKLLHFGGPRNSVVALGQAMAAQRRWVGSQWEALYSLWQSESGWNPMARNPSSGAFGIPQALPASKLGPAGMAGDPAAQINWGMDYIASRYGTPMAAWAFWQRQRPHWYDSGGWLPPGVSVAVNATGRPERVLGPRETLNAGITVDLRGATFVGSAREIAKSLAPTLANEIRAEQRRRGVAPSAQLAF